MISAFDLFKIGIGPSSSHTVGPMKAAKAFADALAADPARGRVARVVATLYGSLAWTGAGHGTGRAVLLGLAGEVPATIDANDADTIIAEATLHHRLQLAGGDTLRFDPETDIVFDMISEPPSHPNTLQFQALDAAGEALFTQRWCSVGGGFVVPEGTASLEDGSAPAVPYPFANADDLLRHGERSGQSIAAMMRENEIALHGEPALRAHLAAIGQAMFAAIDRGLATTGTLPGGLKVKRRAAAIHAQLQNTANARAPEHILDVLSVYAMAVNEENAAGGRVVTAPTNGAAGVIPAVLRYYRDHVEGASPTGIEAFLLTATAIGALFKMNASISGAEVGCQGEVGVACAMAAAGLTAALGGTNAQIENAAEIGMEHHLGMTCDPIAGLVQIPCIERNAFGAVKAVTAASLARRGDGTHLVSLDQVIKTMRDTGADMNSKYKETSRGGLAVSWVEC